MQPITAKLSAVNGRGWEAELEGGNMVRGMGGLMLYYMQGVIHNIYHAWNKFDGVQTLNQTLDTTTCKLFPDYLNSFLLIRSFVWWGLPVTHKCTLLLM